MMIRNGVVRMNEYQLIRENCQCIHLDSHYVLANYKTEQCKRPPRLCRQGYACPQYHNPRDRRRNPSIFKYK